MKTKLWTIVAAFAAAACSAEPGKTPAPAPAKEPAAAPAAESAKEAAKETTKPTAAPTKLVKSAPSGKYPLTTCVVSGDKLGEMGDPVAYTWGDTEVQFAARTA